MLNVVDLQKLFVRDDFKVLVTSYEKINLILSGACGPVALFLSYRLHLQGIKSFVSSLEIEPPNSHTICVVDKIVIDCACNYLVKNVGTASNKPYEFADIIPDTHQQNLKARALYWPKDTKLRLKNLVIINGDSWNKSRKAHEYTS